MSKAVPILFLVLILGVGLFIFRSGAIGKGISLLNGLSKSFSSTSTATTNKFPGRFYSPQFASPVYRSVISPPPRPIGSPASTITASKINPHEIPQGFTEKDLSPYFHKVRIGSVSPGSPSYYGQVVLRANLGSGSPINVTGWILRAKHGSQFVPRAVDFYDPSGLTPETEILLKNNDTLTIYSTQSAIGENLRLNKCIGYLGNYNHFTPPLPMSCPYADRSEISAFSGRCQDYISSLSGCRLPDTSNILLPQDDYGCRSYLDTINYGGCVNRHSNDSDFLSREVRVWSGSRFLDERHDRLLLLDNQGLVVDAYSY